MYWCKRKKMAGFMISVEHGMNMQRSTKRISSVLEILTILALKSSNQHVKILGNKALHVWRISLARTTPGVQRTSWFSLLASLMHLL